MAENLATGFGSNLPKEVLETTPHPRMQDESLTIFQLSPDDIITEFQQLMRGNLYVESNDPLKKGWKNVVTKPMMNEQGISYISAPLLMYANKVAFLSDKEEYQRDKEYEDFRMALAGWLMLHGDDWAVDNKDRDMIMEMICSFVLASLNKSLFGGERTFLKNVESRLERYESSKKGHFPHIFKRGQ